MEIRLMTIIFMVGIIVITTITTFKLKGFFGLMKNISWGFFSVFFVMTGLGIMDNFRLGYTFGLMYSLMGIIILHKNEK